MSVVAFLALAGLGVAHCQRQEPQTTKKVGAKDVFKPTSISPAPFGYYYEGHFLFINKGPASVEVSGIEKPVDGKYEPSFVHFQTLQDKEWKEIAISDYGPNVSGFAMKPGKSYEFVVDLRHFDEQSTPLTGRIGVGQYWSEPFVMDWRKDRDRGVFALAKKEHYQKLRTAFAQAGFKKEVLAGDDFCTRFFESIMKETSVKKTASFHPFVGKVDDTPRIDLNGNIQAFFKSDETRDYGYRVWFSLDPRKFSPEWFHRAVKRYAKVEGGKSEYCFEMKLDDGTNFDSPLYLSIVYNWSLYTAPPSVKDFGELFSRVLNILTGQLKE